MLSKKKIFTLCRPIPAFIPRQLAIDILHDHSEVITLNPLVIGHTQIKPPRHASSDEYTCTWYEIQERIQYIPGMGQMGSGKISFTGCFHDMPWGLQTHVYAPMGVDLRVQYRVAGDQIGSDSQAPRELGLAALGAPTEGLYLRTDIEFISNVALSSFVSNQLKVAIQEMVDRMVKRAEKLDADVLQGMIDDEKMSNTTTAAAENPPAKTNDLHSVHSAPPATQHPSSRLYDPPMMYQSVSRTNEPVAAVELPCNYADSKPTNYNNSQPINYNNSQPTNYNNSQPTNYNNSQPTNYNNSQPINYKNSQPTNYNNTQPTRYPSSRPTSYNNPRPTDYTTSQPNKYMTSQHANHMSSQPAGPYSQSTNYYPPPPSDQAPNSNSNYNNYNDNQNNQKNRYSSADYKSYAPSSEKPMNNTYSNANRWSAADYAPTQNTGKSWS